MEKKKNENIKICFFCLKPYLKNDISERNLFQEKRFFFQKKLKNLHKKLQKLKNGLIEK